MRTVRNTLSVLAASLVLISGPPGVSGASIEGALKVESDGGGLQDGSVTKISGGDTRSLGNPPSDPGSSWAALLLLTN